MLDKIRVHARDELPSDYHANLGKGFDEKCVTFLRVIYDELVECTKQGGTDEEILHWCFDIGRRPSDNDVYVWNEFMRKRGWNDEVSEILNRRKSDAGMADRSDVVSIYRRRRRPSPSRQIKWGRAAPADSARQRPDRHLFRQRVDSFRQIEIKFGQTAFAMSRKNQAHFVVANVNIGMVLFVLRNFGYSIHEIDRIGEVIKLEASLNVFFFQLPFGDLFHAVFQVRSFD
jgi:gluconokinase